MSEGVKGERLESGEARRLAELAAAIRLSTLKRLRRVPAGDEHWRPKPGMMSFADLAQHLIDVDTWLLKSLEGEDYPAQGRAGLAETANWETFLGLLEELERSGKVRRRRIKNMSDEELQRKVHGAAFAKDVTTWWMIVRGNLDHEIHHRGQIALYLSLLEHERG